MYIKKNLLSHFNDCTIHHSKILTPCTALARHIYSSTCHGGKALAFSPQAADTARIYKEIKEISFYVSISRNWYNKLISNNIFQTNISSCPIVYILLHFTVFPPRKIRTKFKFLSHPLPTKLYAINHSLMNLNLEGGYCVLLAISVPGLLFVGNWANQFITTTIWHRMIK
jgi:hypothetical protein